MFWTWCLILIISVNPGENGVSNRTWESSGLSRAQWSGIRWPALEKVLQSAKADARAKYISRSGVCIVSSLLFIELAQWGSSWQKILGGSCMAIAKNTLICPWIVSTFPIPAPGANDKNPVKIQNGGSLRDPLCSFRWLSWLMEPDRILEQLLVISYPLDSSAYFFALSLQKVLLSVN